MRSPAEFADDHLPGAVNLPVLDDDERARVGTMYVQVSAFEARKVGAAIVARNIARIVETYARDKPREWAPLVYCWRGGQRSRALVHVLARDRLSRRAARRRLSRVPPARRRAARAVAARSSTFRVVCGLTGSGKSRLIEALAAAGAQVLDLERLARHRGSLLGDLPGDPQPSQKTFESALLDALYALRCVASRLRRIGEPAHRPAAGARSAARGDARRAVRPARCAQSLRVALLEAEYAHLLRRRTRCTRGSRRSRSCTATRRSRAGKQWRRPGTTAALAAELLELHYDPSYERAIQRNFPRYRNAAVLRIDDTRDAAFRALARQLLRAHRPPRTRGVKE